MGIGRKPALVVMAAGTGSRYGGLKQIDPVDEQGTYTEDEGKTWAALPGETIVSMNLWGFTPSILGELDRRFAAFLEASLPGNPLKCEYFLPFVVDEILKEGKAEVTVLKSKDRWYGVTYKEDKETNASLRSQDDDTGMWDAVFGRLPGRRCVFPCQPGWAQPGPLPHPADPNPPFAPDALLREGGWRRHTLRGSCE